MDGSGQTKDLRYRPTGYPSRPTFPNFFYGTELNCSDTDPQVNSGGEQTGGWLQGTKSKPRNFLHSLVWSFENIRVNLIVCLFVYYKLTIIRKGESLFNVNNWDSVWEVRTKDRRILLRVGTKRGEPDRVEEPILVQKKKERIIGTRTERERHND